jgi:GH25 family lysozyme M1 (1,4-beta-N-acetylmuramidase)
MWQLCNNGKIEGIDGAVDIDILYDAGIIKK